MPDIRFDSNKPRYRFVSHKLKLSGDVQVDPDRGVITWATPVYYKFVGQHWMRLQSWLHNSGGVTRFQVKEEKQHEFDFTKEASNVVV